MDVNRAQEIIRSPERFEVIYNGKPVWLESVDSMTKTVTVHLENTEQEETMTVRVNELSETRPH